MNNKMIGKCVYCEEYYCMECSEHSKWEYFCSEECEIEFEEVNILIENKDVGKK